MIMKIFKVKRSFTWILILPQFSNWSPELAPVTTDKTSKALLENDKILVTVLHRLDVLSILLNGYF